MIDWARVSELRDEVGAEDFDEVVELLWEEVDEAIAALRDLMDLSKLEPQCDFLKGSALNIGFREFANLCQAGEAAAAAGATAVVQPGGSIKDADVIAAANRLGLAMVFTGRRHFRH